jgi:hypothetical protein
MKNPGNDFHRRDADARWANELIRGEAQAKLNAREWLRRSDETNDVGLACRLIDQAQLELRPYGH